MSDLEKEKSSWTSDKSDVEKKFGELEGELAKAKDEVENGKMALFSHFEGGFERAKSQMAFLFPELDLSALDSLKIVQDGEIIDEPWLYSLINLISFLWATCLGVFFCNIPTCLMIYSLAEFI